MRYARVSLQAHAFIAFGIALASRAIFYPVSQNTTRATSGLMQACLLRANNPTSGIRVSASESCQELTHTLWLRASRPVADHEHVKQSV